MAEGTLKQGRAKRKPLYPSKIFHKALSCLLIFTLTFNNLALATHQILELDAMGSRSHTGLSYPAKERWLTKDAFLPSGYVKDTLLDDTLRKITQEYIEEKKITSPYKITLDPLFYTARLVLRNMMAQVKPSRDYTITWKKPDIPAKKSDVECLIYQLFRKHVQSTSINPSKIGLDLLDKDGVITWGLSQRLLYRGIDLLKDSGKPVYEGSGYLLTQDAKGHIAVSCPHNVLSYPLFAEDRLLSDTYLPKDYVHHPLLDQPLWEEVHKYANGSLSTLEGAVIPHLEPLFYVARKALDEVLLQAEKSSGYTSSRTRSSFEKQLHDAIEYHVCLTPLFKQDKTFNITKSLAPLLFNKGIRLLQTSKTSLSKDPRYPYTLTLNAKKHLSSLCPYNGLLYPLFPDERLNSQAFFPSSYGRNGNEVYLGDFLSALAGEIVSRQDRDALHHVFAPLPFMVRTAFKDTPVKSGGFPSFKESIHLLMAMAADAVYDQPAENFLSKAQKFFSSPLPFKKINEDTLVHEHLCQNMLPPSWKKERWALGNLYWKLTSPIAQWGVIAKVIEEIDRKYQLWPNHKVSLFELMKVVEVLEKNDFEIVSMDKPERKIFLDRHMPEGFGRKAAKWAEYDFIHLRQLPLDQKEKRTKDLLYFAPVRQQEALRASGKKEELSSQEKTLLHRMRHMPFDSFMVQPAETMSLRVDPASGGDGLRVSLMKGNESAFINFYFRGNKFDLGRLSPWEDPLSKRFPLEHHFPMNFSEDHIDMEFVPSLGYGHRDFTLRLLPDGELRIVQLETLSHLFLESFKPLRTQEGTRLSARRLHLASPSLHHNARILEGSRLYFDGKAGEIVTGENSDLYGEEEVALTNAVVFTNKGKIDSTAVSLEAVKMSNEGSVTGNTLRVRGHSLHNQKAPSHIKANNAVLDTFQLLKTTTLQANDVTLVLKNLDFLERLNQFQTERLFLDLGDASQSWTIKKPLAYGGSLAWIGSPKTLTLLGSLTIQKALAFFLPQTLLDIGDEKSLHPTLLKTDSLTARVQSLDLRHGGLFSQQDMILEAAKEMRLGRAVENVFSYPQTEKEIKKWVETDQRWIYHVSHTPTYQSYDVFQVLMGHFKKLTKSLGDSTRPKTYVRNGSYIASQGNMGLSAQNLFLDHLDAEVRGNLEAKAGTSFHSAGSSIRIQKDADIRSPHFLMETKNLLFTSGWEDPHVVPHSFEWIPPLTPSILSAGGHLQMTTSKADNRGGSITAQKDLMIIGDLKNDAVPKVVFAKAPENWIKKLIPEQPSTVSAKGKTTLQGNILSQKGSVLKECALTSTAVKVWDQEAKQSLRKTTEDRFQNFIRLFDHVQLSRLFEESTGTYWIQPSLFNDPLPALAEPVVVNGSNPKLPAPHPMVEVRLIEESLNAALKRGFIKSGFPSGLEGLQKLRDNAQKIAQEWKSRGRQLTDQKGQGILSLTGKQGSCLNEPALFYEEAEMKDRKILTPVLYLPSSLQDQSMTSTSMIQSGEDLLMTGQLILMEGGSLRSDQNIKISGQKMLVQGTRLKGKDINLQSSESLDLLPFQMKEKFGNWGHAGYVCLNFPAILEGQNVTLTSEGKMTLQSSQITASQNIAVRGEKGLSLPSSQNILHEERERTESGGLFSGDKTIHEVRHREIPQVTMLKAGNQISLVSDKEKLSLEGAKLTSQQGIDLKAPQDKIQIKPVKELSHFQSQGSSSGILWQTSHNEGYTHLKVINTLFDPGAGKVVMTAGKGIEASLRNKMLTEDEPLQKALENRKDVTRHWIQEQHKSWHETHKALGAPLAATLAIGIACLTAGTGSSLGGAFISQLGLQGTTQGLMISAGVKAGFSTLVTQGVIGTLNHEGNVLESLKDMGSGKALRSTAISMLTAGVSKGLGNEMGLLEAEKNLQAPLELEHHVKQGLVQGLSKMGVEGILSRDDFSKVLERSLREGVANTTGGFMSSQIGLMSKTGEIDPVTQKIAHAAIGAAEAAIMDGHPVSGAIGAVVGEMVGEMYRDQKEKEGLFNPNNEDFLEMVDQGVDIARFTAASVACLMGEDPEIAALTAGNAARYNAMFVIPSIVKGSLYVAGVALTIHEACEVYELYQTQGAEAAINRLAVDGAVIVVTGGIGKGVHKAYQVGTKMYPSAALAWEAVQAQSPVFYAMGQKIGGAKEWVKKGIVAFDEATEKLILKTRTKIAQEEGFEVSKLSQEAKQKMLGEKILKQEESFLQNNKLSKSNVSLKFEKDSAEQHFAKHARQIQKSFDRDSYNLKDYMEDANHIINNGIFVPELNGFIKLIGGKGQAKVGFVGIKRSENIITTFHIEKVKDLVKEAPSLGWLK